MSHDKFKVKRWRPRQFSLRILMLLMLVVAAFFGSWEANNWNRKQVLRQRWNQLQPLTTPLRADSFQEAEFFKESQKSRAERVQEREQREKP